jgi:thymidylate synthase (FAD)
MEKLLMKVKLISHTIACANDLENVATPTDLIAYCARVSNPSNQYNMETADKLISYLIKWKHWSPFEMVNATLEIETTRDIARQILRHRSFTFQEFSQRYADPVKELEFVTREARLQDQKNRQNSIETDDTQLQEMWDKMQWDLIEKTRGVYNWAISQGIAKEVARAVLPEGLTTSRMYVNGTLRSWIHYIDIRSDKATQKEHRMIALECAKAISEIFPLINNFSHYESDNAK